MVQTNDALKILDRMIGDDADMRQMIAEETLKAQIARMISEARTAAGLTQQALAARVGTTPSVIARLEEADVDSDALFLLHRIAAALGHALDIRLVPAPAHRQSA
jgi:ribosome-binding protein aMBF1 (putative translation factor)